MTSRRRPRRPAPFPQRLRRAEIPAPVVHVVRTLKDAGHRTYLVGGCVRDLVRGGTAKDYDVATRARPAQVQSLFRRVIPTGIAHGTVTVLAGTDLPVEVTTFRGEGAYLDGRRPSEVRFLDAIEDDLARRDFTINAMAFDPLDGSLVDPFDGQGDLGRRVVRCVGDPAERFAEDGLRPLRAVRFAATLGFNIAPHTRRAIPAALATFRKVSVERVREEFARILAVPRPARGLRLLARTGLLSEFLSEVAPSGEPGAGTDHLVATTDRAAPDLDVRLAALLHRVGRSDGCNASPGPGEAAAAVARRLRFPGHTVDRVERLVRELPAALAKDLGDAALRRLASRVGREHLVALGDLAWAHAASAPRAPGARAAARIRGRLRAVLRARPPLSAAELALDGEAVMAALGTGPGPRVGGALRHLLESVLEDPALNTRERLEALLRDWAGTHGG